MTKRDAPAGVSQSVTAVSNRLDWRLVLLALGSFAVGTDSFVIAGLLVVIADEFDISIAMAGQLITVYALCYALFTPISAVIMGNWPRQRVLLIGILIFVMGNLIAAFGSDFFMVLAGRGVSGLGAAIFVPTASATAATIVADRRRASALAVMMIALSTATAFGAPIGTIIGTLSHLRYTFIMIAAIGAVVTIGIAAFLVCPATSAQHSLRSRMQPIHDRRVLLVLLATFLVLCGLYITYTYIGAVFDRATHDDGVTLALLISIWGIAGTAGSIASGRFTDRIGSRMVINGSLTILILNFTSMPWTSATLDLSIIALLVWGLCGWAFVIPQQHRLIGLAPQHGSILLSLYAMAVYGGTSISGAIGGIAATFVGFHQLPLIGSVLIAGGLAASEYAFRIDRPALERPDIGTAIHQ